jgi:hypothetical protein
LSFYVNGSLQASVAYSGGWQATGATAVGRGLYSGSPVDFVNGKIDAVQAFSSALTATQVANLDRDAHWALDGSTIDSSAGGHALAISGGTSWVTGAVGSGALSFDGTGSATTDGTVLPKAGPFSLTGWVKPSSINDALLYGVTDGPVVRLNSSGQFTFTSNGVTVTSATVAKTGNWYHVAAAQDATTLRLYVNGTVDGTASYTDGTNAAAAYQLGAGLKGALDDAQVFNYPLSADDAQLLAAKGVSQISVNADNNTSVIDPSMFGLFLEDINHSGEGGLYAEQINNRSMMASSSSAMHWAGVNSTIALDATQPLNSALTQSLKITSTASTPSARTGVANEGFWGIPVKPAAAWTGSFYAKASAGFAGPINVSIEAADGTVYARATIAAITTGWAKYNFRLRATVSAPTTTNAKFYLTTPSSRLSGKPCGWIKFRCSRQPMTVAPTVCAST